MSSDEQKYDKLSYVSDDNEQLYSFSFSNVLHSIMIQG